MTLRLTAAHISLNLADPIDRESGLKALLQEEEERRTTLWENVLLPGDMETVNAARDWRKAVWQMEQYARDCTLDDLSAKVLLAVRHVDEARDRFYTAARSSIGIGGGQVEQASWLSSALRGEARDTSTGSAGSNE